MDEGRVLDIPAIPYADVESQQKERRRAAEGKGQNGGSRRRKPARKPKRGEIGPAIVKAVDEKTKAGMNRTQAFAEVANERGSRPGTVAANYYRMQRKSNPTRTRRARKRSQATTPPGRGKTRGRAAQARTRRSGAPDGQVDISRLAADLVSAVNALAGAITAQQRETQELRARLEEVRSALA